MKTRVGKRVEQLLFVLLFVIVLPRTVLSCGMAESFHESVRLVKSLSVRQKIGQLLVPAVVIDLQQQDPRFASALGREIFDKHIFVEPDYIKQLIRDYGVGGVIFLYKSSSHKVQEWADTFQQVSSIPLLISIDAEWGLAMRLDDCLRFPYARTLAALSNEDLIKDVAYETGRQCRCLGINLLFAPVADVVRSAENSLLMYRAFGDEPETVARKATLYLQGLQGAGVSSCGKHFPGHGACAGDSHLGLPVIGDSLDCLRVRDLIPFKTLIDGGVDMIMMAHVSIPALDECHPASFSATVIKGLLRKELNFSGVIITDSLLMGALASYEPGMRELAAFLAGNDLLLCPTDVPLAVSAIEKAIHENPALEQELDEHVLRILKLKEKMGLLRPRILGHTQDLKALFKPEACKLKKRVYQEAITVVRDGGMVPLLNIPGEKVFLVEYGFDKESLFAQELKKTDRITADLTGAYSIIMALFGMTRDVHTNFGIPAEVFDALAQYKKQHKKVCVVLFGTPYAVNLFSDADGVMVVYEEDPDAQVGAARVLNGTCGAHGVLPSGIAKR